MDQKEILHKVEEAVEHTAEVVVHGPLQTAREFFRLEAAGGILLVVTAFLAMIIANSSLYSHYYYFFNEVDFRIGFSDIGGGDIEIKKSILLWINDGLMAVFFFLVGLEIKRDFIEGELSSRESAMLPALAAVGGMAVPVAIYWLLNRHDPAGLDGWAIPAATDIAFALGVLGVLGSRVPTALKSLLLGIAVIDDIGAILIIAIFFSHKIVIPALIVAAVAIGVLAFLNRRCVSKLSPYIVVTIILWVAVLESGIHATIAGVIAALFIPLRCVRYSKYSPLKTLEHSLHNWVAYLVLPLFAFANAGVPLKGLGIDSLGHPVTLGIAAGLFIGKQIGVFSVIVLTVWLGICRKPEGTSWLQLYGVSILCGIGFTMSLFIGGLAFSGLEMQASLRLGVLIGSIASAVVAYLLLRFAPPVKQVQPS